MDLLRRCRAGINWSPLIVLGLILGVALLLAGCDSFKQKPGDTGNIAVDATHDYGQNIHTSLEAGHKTECANNLSQLRMAIMMKHDADGQYPASLADLDQSVRALETCPDTGKPYQYDPSTGRVWCTTPGHEKL